MCMQNQMALAHPVWTSRFHQPYRTQGGEVRHNGRAKGYRQILKEVPHAVVNLIPIFITCSSFLSPFRSWGIHPPPKKFEIQFKIPNSFFPVRKIFFFNWESDFLRAFQSHDKGTTSVGGSHTLPDKFTCYLAGRPSWRFALLRGLLLGVLAEVAAEGYSSSPDIWPFPAPPICYQLPLTLHIFFQLQSGNVNYVPLTCAPRIGRSIGTMGWCMSFFLRNNIAKHPIIRKHSR